MMAREAAAMTLDTIPGNRYPHPMVNNDISNRYNLPWISTKGKM